MAINNDSKMDALDIEHELIDVVKGAGPNGLSFKDGCRLMGVEYNRYTLLVETLVCLGRFKIERSQSGNENRLFLPEQEPPTRNHITAKQREVLDYLISKMDEDGLACISYREIAKHTSCRMPSFAIERLDYKGFLETVDHGGPYANIYRIYPNREGPRGHSSRWFQ